MLRALSRSFLVLGCLLCAYVAIPLQAQAPIGLTAKAATNKRVDLTWSGTAASYVVERRPLGGTYSDLATISSTTASDAQIDPYTTYQYQVLAVTGSGRSAPSNEVTVGPPPAGYSAAAQAPAGHEDHYGYDLSLVLDGNGDPAFAFLFDDPNQDTDHSDTQLLFRSWSRAKYAWNPLVTVATVGDVATYFHSSVSLAYDASTNTLGIATEANQGNSRSIKLYVSADGGVTWTLKNTFQEDNSASAPALALGNGNLYLAYDVSFAGLKYVTGKLSSAPATWQAKLAPKPANTDIALEDTTIGLALDSAGNPGIAYGVPDTTKAYNSVVLFWRPNGSANPVRVIDSENNQSDVAVKLKFFQTNPRVTVHLQRNDADFGVGIHFAKSDDGGNTWSAPVVIPPDGNSSTDYPFDMALDSQDHGAIAFGQNSGSGDAVCGNPKLSLSADLAHWTTCSTSTDDVTNNFDVYPGGIAVTYGANDKLYYFWWQVGDNGTGTGIVMWRQSDTGGAPSILTTSGVVNGATFQPGVVPGSWISILGANLSDVSDTWANADFSNGTLPTSLHGVQVKVGGQLAAVYYVSQKQLNVQAPGGISGSVPVQVIHNNVASNTVTASVVSNSPGLFTYPLGSNTFPAAVFLDGVIVGDPALAASTRKAKPGDRIQLYATGLEATPAGVIINAPAAVSKPVTVKIGPADATVEFAGLTAVGEFQINIVVPNLQPGNYPLTLTIAGQTSQAGITMPVGQ